MKEGILLLFVACLCSCSTTIYLVRHGEKVDNSADPNLSDKGEKRAIALKDTLANAGLKAVYATQFKRTFQTAQPAAEAKNITITRYNSSVSDSLITALSNKKGNNFLVVGHSNTVPDILKEASHNTFTVTISDSQYDNIFIVVMPDSLTGTVTHLKYGRTTP